MKLGLALLCLLFAACGDDDGDDVVDAGPDADAGEEDASIGFPGLTDEVEIIRDDRGIPHVYASTDEDVFYGGGYAIARDRLSQMDLLRRRGLGRWSEVTGAAHERDDVLSRVLGFRDLAKGDADVLRDESPAAFALVVAWAAGVNRRIEEIRAGDAPMPYGFTELDYEPELWTPEDVVMVSRLGFFSTSNTLENELTLTVINKLFPIVQESIEILRPFYEVYAVPDEDRPGVTSGPLPAPPPARAPVPYDREQLLAGLKRMREYLGDYRVTGSNNWAVDGRFTENGRPLLANDPHLPLEIPNVMFPLHLHSKSLGGTLDVAGFNLAGSAGISLGHNDRIGWAATTNFADVMDTWEVRTTATGVMIGDEEVAWVELDEPIRVRDESAEGGYRTQMLKVRTVPEYGVILPSDIAPIPIAGPGRVLLLNYTGFSRFRGADSLLKLQRAQSIDDFEEAIDGVPGLGFNFVAADADGISYRVGQAVPDRGDPRDIQPPWLVIDGTDADSYWTGEYLDSSRLPHSRAEETGFIATANNDPFGFTENGRLDDDPWYYGALFEPGFRAQRIVTELERLTARGDVTPDDMVTLQRDAHAPTADRLLPFLAEAMEQIPTNDDLEPYRDREDLMTLADSLASWDRQMRRDSKEALAYRLFLFELASVVTEDELGPFFSFGLEASVFLLKIALLCVFEVYHDSAEILDMSPELAVLTALDRAAVILEDRYGGVGPSDDTYGDIHGAFFASTSIDDLAVGFVSADGAEDTINVSGATYRDGMNVAERWDSTAGPVFRVVTSFGEDGVPETVATFPMGVSEEPDSEHYRDALGPWIEGEPTLFPFTREDVEAAMTERVVLEAEGTAR